MGPGPRTSGRGPRPGPRAPGLEPRAPAPGSGPGPQAPVPGPGPRAGAPGPGPGPGAGPGPVQRPGWPGDRPGPAPPATFVRAQLFHLARPARPPPGPRASAPAGKGNGSGRPLGPEARGPESRSRGGVPGRSGRSKIFKLALPRLVRGQVRQVQRGINSSPSKRFDQSRPLGRLPGPRGHKPTRLGESVPEVVILPPSVANGGCYMGSCDIRQVAPFSRGVRILPFRWRHRNDALFQRTIDRRPCVTDHFSDRLLE